MKLRNHLFELRVRLQYALFIRRSHFTERSQYLNMGYWKGSPRTLDEASQALVQLTGEIGRFQSSDCILDVGFGFADQDLFWMEHFAPRYIVGLDIADFQVKVARQRVAERAMADRINLGRGSATAMGFNDSTFDKVVSVESAFHFATREDFFSEAKRVLRAGGRLVVADMIPQADGNLSLSRMSPKTNLYPRDVYALKLAKAGFTAIEVFSIRDHVCLPFCEHIACRLQDLKVVRRMSPISRGMITAAANPELYVGLDYVIATAIKEQESRID